MTLGWSPGGDETSKTPLLSTYRAWPSSYDVKTQRSTLTKKDNRQAFSLAFLQTDRGETREQKDGRRLFIIIHYHVQEIDRMIELGT